MELTGNVQGLIDFVGGGSEVEVTPILGSGTKIATINVDGVTYDLYAPTPETPEKVSVTPVLESGTKIATISVDGESTDIYAPSVVYSSNEEVIGTYLGDVLYQKTWLFSEGININNSGWSITPILIGNIKRIINSLATNGLDACWSGCIQISWNSSSSEYVRIMSARPSGSAVVKELTLQYTKIA